MTVKIKEDEMLFKLYAPSQQKSYDLNDDGTLTIEGIASTTNRDLEGDVILESAIDSMKIQLTTTRKNLHGDHRYNLFEGILGAITKVVDSDNNILKIRATILSKFASTIKEMLDIGVQLGLSIGGRIKDYDQTNDGWEIKDIDLFEISLTGMPANYDTFGTVVGAEKKSTDIVESKCLAGACHLIRKNMEANKMAEDGNSQNNDEKYVTREEIESICKDYMDSYLAENKEEIQNAILEACKADIERIVDEKIKEITEPQPPANNNNEGENGAKSFTEALKTLKEELLDEINKNKFTDEDLQKGLADYVNKERNPTPTPAPQQDNKGEGEAVKTYTAEEIYKNIEANQKSHGIFSMLKEE